MKKKMMAIVMAFVLVQFGCEKEEVQTQAEEAEQVVATDQLTKTGCSPNFAANPYDNVGVMHNVMMDRIVSVVRAGDDVNRIIEISDSILIEEYGPEISVALTTAAEVQFYIDEIEEDNYTAQINALNLSALQKTKLIELFTIAADYDETNACQVISSIMQFEADLMANYTTAQVEYVLIASSIMRHSMFYWDNFNPGNKAFWKKLIVAVADVAGGIAGGLAGGPTVVGNVAGAIAGAAGASGGAAGTITFFENH